MNHRDGMIRWFRLILNENIMFLGIQFGNTNITCAIFQHEDFIIKKIKLLNGDNYSLNRIDWDKLNDYFQKLEGIEGLEAIAYTVPKQIPLSSELFDKIEDKLTVCLQELTFRQPKFLFVPKYIAAHTFIKGELEIKDENFTICHFGGKSIELVEFSGKSDYQILFSENYGGEQYIENILKHINTISKSKGIKRFDKEEFRKDIENNNGNFNSDRYWGLVGFVGENSPLFGRYKQTVVKDYIDIKLNDVLKELPEIDKLFIVGKFSTNFQIEYNFRARKDFPEPSFFPDAICKGLYLIAKNNKQCLPHEIYLETNWAQQIKEVQIYPLEKELDIGIFTTKDFALTIVKKLYGSEEDKIKRTKLININESILGKNKLIVREIIDKSLNCIQLQINNNENILCEVKICHKFIQSSDEYPVFEKNSVADYKVALNFYKIFTPNEKTSEFNIDKSVVEGSLENNALKIPLSVNFKRNRNIIGHIEINGLTTNFQGIILIDSEKTQSNFILAGNNAKLIRNNDKQLICDFNDVLPKGIIAY